MTRYEEAVEELASLKVKYPTLYEFIKVRDFRIRRGWFQIIRDFSEKLEKDFPDFTRAVQIKEKFGTLRIYLDTGNSKSSRKYILPLIEPLITEVELQSAKTCELCGSWTGMIRNINMYIQTLCDKCFQIETEKTKE